MRKTSQDGGDSTSVTSGLENEMKKPGQSILKTKRNSIKRKVQSLSHESDEAVIEPLLQKDEEKPSTSNQSAKYDLLSKTKTDLSSDRGNDKEKLLHNDKTQKASVSGTQNVVDTVISIPSSNQLPKCTGVTAPIHNHMNTNVFNSHDALKGLVTTKSQILVEIDESKQSGYNPSPLIFTTAKIHTDGKSKQMEPLQVTPVPILSTIEVSVLKGTDINRSGETSGIVTSNISSTLTNIPVTNVNVQDKDQKTKPIFQGVSKPFNTTEKRITSSVLQTKDITESKKEKEVKPTKLSLSQPVSGPSSGSVNTIAENAVNKPITTGVGGIITQTNKDTSVKQSMKKGTIDEIKSTAPKTDVNKNITPIDNKSIATGKDKIAMNSTSTATKQLQRQKIVIDKEDPTMKFNPDTQNSSTIQKHESKPLKKLDESVASISQTKSLVNDGSRLSEKTKLPTSTHNTQISSIKPPATGHAYITSDKPIKSNSITSIKPIDTTKAQAMHTVNSKPSTSTKSGIKTHIISETQAVPTSTQSISNIKPSLTQSGPKAKTESQTLFTKSPDFNTKDPAVSKNPLISTNTNKNPLASTNVGKTPTISTNVTKSPSISANTIKSSTLITSTAKNAPTTNTTKSLSITPSNSKLTANSTSTEKSSSGSTSTAKGMPVSTSSEKPSSVPTIVSKTPVSKSNVTPASKASVILPAISSTVVGPSTTTVSTQSASNSSVHKKTEAKSTECSNKSMKA